jgi:PKHD-type hydroxylase
MSMMDRHVPRKLSMSLLLSDPSEFEGGEFEVKTDSDIPINLEQKRGRAWFFPSWALHRVTPVTKGVRKSLVLWVGGPPFK